jgi:hypothetical protein
MSLSYAVDRLYEVGWLPEGGVDLDRLGDGRRYPSLRAIQQLLGEHGLSLSVKQNQKFKCYQATWAPADEEPDPGRSADDRHGTVVGDSEAEAAVYALAQVLVTQRQEELAAG